MTIGRHGDPAERGNDARPPAPSSRCWLCAGMLVLALPAHAGTPGEEALRAAPMPHVALGSTGSAAATGTMVKVHLVSARGYLQGRPDDAIRRAQLRAQVDACVRRNSARGMASKPPRAWPEHILSERMDTYAAANRTIQYTHGLAYALDQADCSLIEARNSSAHLYSTQGSCTVDLIARTAHGACDATGQARARPPASNPQPGGARQDAIERTAASNPAMAAMAAAMRAHAPGGTGERKNILGIECDVRPNPLDPEGRTCLSRGGAFASLDAGGDPALSGLTLEMTSPSGMNLLATQAQLDTEVNSAVFTPYLAAGFRISRTAPRP